MTAHDPAGVARGLPKGVSEALLRCTQSTLGAVQPSTDEDAKLLFDAGLSWTHTHWWRQLNTRGLRIRERLRAHPTPDAPPTPTPTPEIQ